MRILVVGAGAVGGYFGARLVRAGREVDFLVRPARAELLRRNGLRVRDVDGAVETVPVTAVTADALSPGYDLVVLAVKSYGFDSALKDITPAVGANTVVLPFLNGMRHVDALTGRFGADRVYGGVAMVMTRLGEDGEIVEVGTMARLIYGPLTETPVIPPADVHAALDTGTFSATAVEDAMRELWDKWVFLATMGACNCLMRAPIGRVNSAEGGRDFTRAVFEEAAAVAAASGHPLRPETRERADAMVGDTTASTTTSLYWDLTRGNPVEADHIVGDLVARGRSLGVPTPLFALADLHLRVYEAGRA
ncbi:ketopantoate reductase family protein [Nocardiopsis sp. N85]|uniref:ketopantoate reductase family protein n=1 Tax=Nocardiopsis sp. N85 TaxID=3029400 RepID=UPI00237F85C3|nr:ketopantoate reductase family protein [Nocardiopsis sp. N85]MDE3724644.1 ketopantoate reductase family protein [Nocardiopsis sp. N85]